MKTMKLFLVLFLVSMGITVYWNKVPAISQSAHFALDPTLGALLNWNVTYGMIIFVFLITLAMTLIHKYCTDQKTLKELKQQQKDLHKEMKKYKDNPDKLLEFNKKQLEFMPKFWELSMRPLVYTIVFFVLFLRWLSDYFEVVDVKFLGVLSWFWFYFIFSIIFSSIMRKVMKVA